MVTLTRKSNTVEIVFSGSSTYLYDGTISAPLGSLVLITDQSDMATVRRAPSFDILFSAKIADMEFGGTQATMANINSLFDSTCGGNSGGGGGGDMSNYYTKAEIDQTNDQTNRVISEALHELHDTKADTSAMTAAISAATSGKANSSDVYTKTEMDTALSGKQNTLTAGSGISISGDTISVTGGGSGGGTNIVTLTQAQYDALPTKSPDTIYVISDAPFNYYDKTEIDNQIDPLETSVSDIQSTIGDINDALDAINGDNAIS